MGGGTMHECKKVTYDSATLQQLGIPNAIQLQMTVTAPATMSTEAVLLALRTAPKPHLRLVPYNIELPCASGTQPD
jgi:hypothetical protein